MISLQHRDLLELLCPGTALPVLGSGHSQGMGGRKRPFALEAFVAPCDSLLCHGNASHGVAEPGGCQAMLGHRAPQSSWPGLQAGL